MGQGGFPGLGFQFMSPFSSRYVHKSTAMHVNPIPAVFAKNLKEYLRPFFQCLLLRNNQLKVKGKTKIELVTDPTLLFMNQHWGDRVGDALEAVELL